jgi:hypothetical protein
MKFSSSIVMAVLLMPATFLRAVPADEYWDPQFGLPGLAGTSGDIYAIAAQNGQTYASGFFSSTNAPIEAWNGAEWSVVGQAQGYPEAFVYGMAIVGNDLYIGGSFTNVNGVAANGLARWDGANWSSVGFNGVVFGMAVSGNNLYVGGSFTNATADGSVATNIASFDGSAWHELGGGLGGIGGIQVFGLAVQNGLVYAGGEFSNSGSVAVTNLAVWNGSNWSQVGGGVNGLVYSLLSDGGDLIVGGSFTQVGTTPADCVAQWNGSSWSTLGTGVSSGYVFRLGLVNGSVYAAGPFSSIGGVAATNIASWNGSTWSPLGSGVSGTVLSLCSNVTNLYVGGLFGLAGGKIVNLIASWDGANWSGIGAGGRLNGANPSILALASDGTNLFAGGTFTGAGQTSADYIGRFDGTNWYTLGSGIGPAGSIIRAIATGNNGVYVGGSFSTAGGVSAANMAFWNGTNWSALGSGPGGIVASILVRTDGVYAAGAPLYGSGPEYSGTPIFERWDGTNWYNTLNVSNVFFPVPISTPNIAIDAMASMGTNIFVGGQLNLAYYNPNNIGEATSCPDIFQFSGTWAEPVGTGVNSNILAMAVIGTNLFVAGYFTNAGGIGASQIAEWNGANWSALGSGVVGSGTVDALAVIGTNLYAAGTFTNMGGVSANAVAKWNGSTWSALGSGIVRPGLPTDVLGLGSSGNDLYAGGVFQLAGNKASFDVAHWNDQINFNIPQLINPKWLPGGQFRTRLFGVPGVTNIIQASTNFTVWIPVLTNSAGIYDFTDSNSPAYPYRFYRGVLSQ